MPPDPPPQFGAEIGHGARRGSGSRARPGGDAVQRQPVDKIGAAGGRDNPRPGAACKGGAPSSVICFGQVDAPEFGRCDSGQPVGKGPAHDRVAALPDH